MPKTRIMAFTWSTLKNLFSKPVTKNYPAEPIQYPERSRGHIEIEIEKCISCSMCARNCPTGALTVDRKAMTWTINRFDCIACGYCTQKCPKKCLHLVPGYQTPGEEKKEAVYQRPAPAPKPAAAAATAGKPAAAQGAAAPAGKPQAAAAGTGTSGTTAAKTAGASPSGAAKAVLNGDIVTLPNGKTMDLSKLPEANRQNVLKKLGLDKPAEKSAAEAGKNPDGGQQENAAAEPKAVRNGDIITLPNGKTMDLSKLPEANREKVLAKLGLK